MCKKKYEDLIGKKFGRWTVISYAGFDKRHYLNVRCECGKTGKVRVYQLINGESRSCGCLVKEVNRKRRLSHGECLGGRPSPEFRAYCLAKNKCENPTHEKYAHFGGVGVKFLFSNFAEFLRDVGRRPGPKFILKRYDETLHFEPGNLYWTDNKNHQKRNSARNLHI